MLRPALAAIGLLTVHASQAEPLHVPSQYPTIQAAIDASHTDDEIHIAPGVYRELLNPENKSVTLIGAGAGETILWGDSGLSERWVGCAAAHTNPRPHTQQRDERDPFLSGRSARYSEQHTSALLRLVYQHALQPE